MGPDIIYDRRRTAESCEYKSNQFSRLAQQLVVDVVGYELGGVRPVHQLVVGQQCRSDRRAHEFLQYTHIHKQG